MISKIAPVLSSSAFNIKKLNDYLRTGHKEEPKLEAERVRDSFTLNMYAQDLDTACQEMMYTASLNTRSKCSKYMHLVLSLSEGEKLERQRWKDVAQDYLKKVGMSGHQVIAVRHNDNGKEHLHLIINRIDTVKHTRVNDYKLYRKLQKFDEEIERKYHLKEFDHKAAEPHDYQQAALNKAREQELKTEHQTLLTYILEHKEEISKAGSWQELQETLARFDCTVNVKGRGLVFKSMNPEHPAEIKASSFDREFSYAKLVKKWGLPSRDLNSSYQTQQQQKEQEEDEERKAQDLLRRQNLQTTFEAKPLTKRAQWIEYDEYFFRKIAERKDKILDRGDVLVVQKADNYQTIQDLLKIARHRFGDGYIKINGDRAFQRRTMYHALKMKIKIQLTDEVVKKEYENNLRKQEQQAKILAQRNNEILKQREKERERQIQIQREFEAHERQNRKNQQYTKFRRNQRAPEKYRDLDLSR